MPKSAPKPPTLATRLKRQAQTARRAIRAWRLSLPQPVKRALRRVTQWTLHSTLGIVIAVLLIFAAAYLWLPTLAERKGEIESYISSTIGNPVTLGKLDTYWDGLNPGIRVQGLRVQSAATGRQAIRLKELRLSLAWWPLLTGRIEINSLVLVEPSLTVERQADGRLRISGIEATDSTTPTDTDFSLLLRSQKEVIIENGELLWLDKRAAADGSKNAAAAGSQRSKALPASSVVEERFPIRHVHLDLRNNGERHQLEFRADFPHDLCADCRVSADIRGNPLLDKSWNGEIGVQARALSTHGLPRILREALPSGLVGRFDLRLTSQWRDDRPQLVEGRLAVTGLSLPLPDESRPLAIPTLDAKLKWKGSAETWRLDLSGLRLGLTRPAWSAGRLQLDVQPDRRRLEVEHVDVADLAAFTAALPREHAVLTWLRAAQPAGSLNRLRVELAGPMSAPTGYNVDGELRDIRFAAYEGVPGVQGLNGQLSLSQNGGEFRLDSDNIRVAVPRVIREPLALQRLSSRIRWRQNPEDWFVQAQDIALNARDGRVRGDLELRVPKDPAVSPVLKLHADFSDLDGSHTARYLPLTLSDDLRVWIERAVVSGRVAEGSVQFHGALNNFPFRDGKGRFEVRAHIQDAVLNYLPGWEPLRNIDADFYYTGTGLLITSARSKIRSLDVGRLVVAIDDLQAPDGVVVNVNGRVAGPLQDTLGVLVDSKLPLFVSLVPTGLRADGDGSLALSLRIPVLAPKSIGIAGLYQFQNSSLEFPFRAIRVADIQGGVEFSESGLRTGKLNARLLGGDAVFEVVPDATPVSSAGVAAHGTLTQAGLAEVLGPGLSPLVRGQVTWQARLQSRHEGSELVVETNLRDLELRLPAPLAKAQGEPLLLKVRTNTIGDESRLMTLEAEERVTGRLAFQHAASGWLFTRGHIGIGEKVGQLSGPPGLHLSARLPALNVDDWWPLLRDNVGGSQDGDWQQGVNRVSAEIESLEAFGRDFGRLSLDIGHVAGNWRGQLEGDAVAGQLTITRPAPADLALATDNVVAPGRSVIQLTLEHLTLPPARASGEGEGQDLDPRGLPPLRIKSDSFTAEDKALGALEFSAVPDTRGWRIDNLKLLRPESSMAASGLWEIDSRGQQSTRMKAALTSTDFGKLLEILGFPEEIVGGAITLHSNWSWSGAPSAFHLARTDGDFSIVLDNGRIPKISPGAGRVLGALDLRSLARYLTLDFSNVYAKGLTFDTIKGNVAVEKGNAYTRDLVIRTPGADIGLSGRIGLSARDLDLELGVTPHLMEELAITGGLLGGPVVGAAVAVIHSLVKKPFEKGTQIKYTVKGGWDDPVVNRIGPPPAPPGEGQ
jgi:uncharacterized protein (TIGR02099 family)